MPLQNSLQTAPPAASCAETRRTRSRAAVQAQPVFDQADNDLVGNQSAVLASSQPSSIPSGVPRSRSRRRIAPGRSHRNPKMPRDHFGLSSLSGTGRAEKHESSFHLATVEENRHAADHQNRDADVKPHQRSLPRRLTATVGWRDRNARPRIRPLRRNPS